MEGAAAWTSDYIEWDPACLFIEDVDEVESHIVCLPTLVLRQGGNMFQHQPLRTQRSFLSPLDALDVPVRCNANTQGVNVSRPYDADHNYGMSRYSSFS